MAGMQFFPPEARGQDGQLEAGLCAPRLSEGGLDGRLGPAGGRPRRPGRAPTSALVARVRGALLCVGRIVGLFRTSAGAGMP